MAEKEQSPDKGEAKEAAEKAKEQKESKKKKPSLLEQTTSKVSTGDWLRQLQGLKVSEEPPPESLLEEVTFEGIAKYIASDKCKKIVTMAGAGISTSAGIPDFRSPGTGLYDNLQKYDLPNPQAIFSIDYFMEKPEAFFTLAKELAPGSFKPTPCHYFLRLLDKKKKLLMHFTQNIDTLERVAGVHEEKIVEAHGTFHTSHCLKCKIKYSYEWTREKIFADLVPRCEEKDCDGIVKPDIVFFGESLPARFVTNIGVLQECDLLIILGTSLVVQPFASLTSRVKENTPRLYINLEKTGQVTDPFMALIFGSGFNFDGEDNIRDVFWEGTCDDGCYALADRLGWGDELRKLVKDEHARLDKDMAEGKKAEAATKKTTAKSAVKSLFHMGKSSSADSKESKLASPKDSKASPKDSKASPKDSKASTADTKGTPKNSESAEKNPKL